MKLIELQIEETTPTHYLFSIKVETRTFWGKKRTEIIDCQRPVDSIQSKFISTGDCVFMRWSHLDTSINAILSKKSQNYTVLNLK